MDLHFMAKFEKHPIIAVRLNMAIDTENAENNIIDHSIFERTGIPNIWGQL